uniref:Peptidyl-prolyl cis-trans isomerase n=1 Tax=Lutzomyia longipalpis TaxID=7200 RepID=A0A1B0CMH1_LUTLO
MADSTEEVVPAGWEKRLSRSTGMHYYLNIYTKESQWDLPTAPAEPASAQGPNKIQCSHLLGQAHQESPPEFVAPRKHHTLQGGSSQSPRWVSPTNPIRRARPNEVVNLGAFGRGVMQKAFEEAAFALKVGEMSGIVDTDSGLHLILRTL